MMVINFVIVYENGFQNGAESGLDLVHALVRLVGPWVRGLQQRRHGAQDEAEGRGTEELQDDAEEPLLLTPKGFQKL